MDVNSSLFTAVRDGSLERARELIDTYGLSYSKDWSNGYILLKLALDNNHADVAELLLSKGSEVHSESAKGPCNTPLHFAAQNGDIKIVKMILDKNAVSKGADINGKREDGSTPLHLAVQKGYKEIIIMLLANRADVNAQRDDGKTPLHMAVLENLQEITILLLSNGADVNAETKDGSTPLHLVVKNCHRTLIKLLLSQGANLNAQRNEGITPLHRAIKYCPNDIIETILKFGADIYSGNEISKTAIYFAFEYAHVNVIETLLEHGCAIDDVAITEEDEVIFDARDNISREDIPYFDSLSCSEDSDYIQPPYSSINEQIKVIKVQQHIVKMFAANLYVSKQHLELVVDFLKNKMSDFYLECQEQIEYMKSEKINNTDISFYDILAKTTSSLAIYMKDGNIVEVFKSDKYHLKFPIYARMIKCNFQKGMERKELLEQGNQIVHLFINHFAKVSHECTEKIFSYLSNKDLRILIVTFKPLSIGSPIVDDEVITSNISQP